MERQYEAKKRAETIPGAFGKHPPLSTPSLMDRSGYWRRAVGNRAFHAVAGSGFFQCKLKIGACDDAYEREAERVADAVIGNGGTDMACRHHAVAGAGVQRISIDASPSFEDARVVEGEEEKSEETGPGGGSGPGNAQGPQFLRRANGAFPGAASVEEGFAARLTATAAGGEPLAPQVRGFMESRLGAGFDGVRVHRDARAAELSGQIQARAFTMGNHVYFGAGEFAPEGDEGRRVLAHELTHVIQQGFAEPGGDTAKGDAAGPGAGTPHGAVQRLSVLDRTSRENVVRTNVAPWPTPDPRGNDYRVYTDANNEVTAWVAYSGYPVNLRYWCHGHSLGSYNSWMYSVYSGPANMGKVVQDEWQSVTPDRARAGDIAVWLPNYDHSARFTSVATAGAGLDEGATMLSTKNGQADLATQSLRSIMNMYGNGYGTFRRR